VYLNKGARCENYCVIFPGINTTRSESERFELRCGTVSKAIAIPFPSHRIGLFADRPIMLPFLGPASTAAAGVAPSMLILSGVIGSGWVFSQSERALLLGSIAAFSTSRPHRHGDGPRGDALGTAAQ
jgi:hypothetical protein